MVLTELTKPLQQAFRVYKQHIFMITWLFLG